MSFRRAVASLGKCGAASLVVSRASVLPPAFSGERFRAGFGRLVSSDTLHSGSSAPVSELLAAKKNAGADLFVHSDSNVLDSVKKMAANKVGCLVVVDHPNGEPWDQDAGDIVGIISERDYLTKVAIEGRRSETTPTSEIMTRIGNVKTVTPHTAVIDAMTLMTRHNVRHLPVVENGQFLGMLSIRDVVETVVTTAKADVEGLQEYISGSY